MPVPLAPSSPRLAYDIDGSYVFMARTQGGTPGVPYDLAPAAVAALNADRGQGLGIPSSWWLFPTDMAEYTTKNYICVVFPTAMRLTEMFLSAFSSWSNGGIPGNTSYHQLDVEIQTSQDSTNGLDGNWKTSFIHDTDNPGLARAGASELPALLPDGTAFSHQTHSLSPGFEMYQPGEVNGLGWIPLHGTAFKNVRAIRLLIPQRPVDAYVYFNQAVFNLHLYGYYDEAATTHRLEFTGDLSFGDIGMASTAERIIHLHNASPALSATGVTLTVESSHPVETPNPTPSIQLSLDGSSWGSGLSIPTIAPGADSVDIHVRLDPVADLIGFRHARLKTSAVIWA